MRLLRNRTTGEQEAGSKEMKRRESCGREKRKKGAIGDRRCNSFLAWRLALSPSSFIAHNTPLERPLCVINKKQNDRSSAPWAPSRAPSRSSRSCSALG